MEMAFSLSLEALASPADDAYIVPGTGEGLSIRYPPAVMFAGIPRVASQFPFHRLWSDSPRGHVSLAKRPPDGLEVAEVRRSRPGVAG